MKDRKTPQEKKALSYKKDKRNVYGANDKASKKIIPLRKAKRNRAYRKKVNDILAKAGNEIDLEELDLAENEVKSIKKDGWRKCPDVQLGKVVEKKNNSRQEKVGMGKTAQKHTRELIENLEIEITKEEDVWIAKARKTPGIQGEGDTKDEAIKQLKYIANAAIKNSMGFTIGISIDGNYTEPILEIEKGK